MKSDKLKERIHNLLSRKTEEELVREDAYSLMATYLSEIERLQSVLGFNKKELSEKINTSGSYLTQVFKGNKPLNFFTIAKIQKALNIRFDVTTVLNNDFVSIYDESKFFENIQNYKSKSGTWVWKNINFNELNYTKYSLDKEQNNESKALTA